MKIMKIDAQILMALYTAGKPMVIADIIQDLDINRSRSTVYRHLGVLTEAGYTEIVATCDHADLYSITTAGEKLLLYGVL